MARVPERIPLSAFLEGLPAEAADQLRDVATIMLRNEQAAVELRGVEAELRPYFYFSVCSFIAGLVAILYFSEPGGLVDRIDGSWPVVIAALGFLPGLMTYYAFRIRKRSQSDVQNLDLNKAHFVPHGAIYFPSDSEADEQMVTLVDAQQAPGRPSRYDRLKPGTIW